LPGQGPPIKPGEFVLGYPGRAGVPLPIPRPDVLERNSTFVGLRKHQSRVGTFNRFLREHARTEQERRLLAAKPVGRWRSGAPLTRAHPAHEAARHPDVPPRRREHPPQSSGAAPPTARPTIRMRPRSTTTTFRAGSTSARPAGHARERDRFPLLLDPYASATTRSTPPTTGIDASWHRTLRGDLVTARRRGDPYARRYPAW
jgi:hypothetical protein